MKRNVLIVDDNADDRRVVKRHLGRDNYCEYVFREASSGSAGLAELTDQTPDVVVLDHHLGESNGIEVLDHLRRTSPREVAVVFLTGSDGLRADPLEHGADDYLSKEEITGQQLRRAVDNAVVKARTRAALERSRAELEHALEELTRRAEFEGRMMGVVSHDLRTPLQTLELGLNVVAAHDAFPEALESTVQRMQRSTRRMTSMVGQLLDLTRIRGAGRFPVSLTNVDVHDIVQQQVEELSVAHPDRRILWTCKGHGRGAFDAVAVGQLVTNLLGNALQHGTASEPIRVLAEGSAGRLVLEVANHGDPIPSHLRRQLFEPFHRGPTSGRGLGLGLYISRQIVRAHDGTIDVSCEAGDVVFRATLPLRAMTTQPAPQSSSSM